MATITLQINGTTVGNLSVTNTLPTETSNRLMGYLASVHGTKQVDVDGVMQTAQRTPQEMVEAYWAGIVAGTGANVVRWEQEQAAIAAAQAVTPFTVE